MSGSLLSLLSCTHTSMQVTQYTFLPMDSHYSTDIQVVEMRQDMQPHARKGKEDEDCCMYKEKALSPRIHTMSFSE